MRVTTLKAISFDLWDTIIDDDSDEPKRKARGLRPKAAERRHLLWQALLRHGAVSLEEVARAFDAADAAFNKAWRVDTVTWKIEERLNIALMELGRELPRDELEALALALGRMELEVMPDLIAGIDEALKALYRRYTLCVVSDAIVTPGPALRMLLERHRLSRYFQGFAFSDEVGRSKPHRSMFESAARQLDVVVTEMIHVGDRERNDIAGPKALGMKTVLFTAKRDADKADTAADAVCERAHDLPQVIDALAARASVG
jgi:putative hydrolase of the HAD superfamily